jgi:hypothetical protein
LEIAEEERQTRAGETRGPETKHLRHLEVWIEEQIRVRAKGEAVKPKKSSEVIEERHTGGYTYRLECVWCGKESCQCMDNTGHGPYSYAYRKEGRRTKSKYIDKKLKDPGCTRAGKSKRISPLPRHIKTDTAQVTRKKSSELPKNTLSQLS